MRADFLSRTVSTKDEKAADLEDDSALVFTLGSASEQDTPVTPSVRRPPGGRRTMMIMVRRPPGCIRLRLPNRLQLRMCEIYQTRISRHRQRGTPPMLVTVARDSGRLLYFGRVIFYYSRPRSR